MDVAIKVRKTNYYIDIPGGLKITFKWNIVPEKFRTKVSDVKKLQHGTVR